MGAPLFRTSSPRLRFRAGFTLTELLVVIAIIALLASPLHPYLGHIGVYHCPGDLRTRNLQPGHGWAYDSYSKANGMNGVGCCSAMLNTTEHQPPYRKLAELQAPAESLVFRVQG